MAMKRCPICGEKYSETYRDCPFCEEEEALREGEEIRRNARRGKRTAQGGRRFSLITPMLIVLIIIMAALLIYLLRDNDAADDQDSTDPNLAEEVQGDAQTQEPDDGTQEADDSQSGVMPEDSDPDSDTPSVPVQDDEPDESANSDYETAAKLPDGLSLSTTDFTLKSLGETHTIKASGGSSTYKWISQDDGIASVDQNGKVVAVSNGTTNVLVTDGSKKAVCIVRVNAPASSTGTTTTTTTTTSSDSGSLKVGSAVVINGGNGVRVRSGPGTDYDVLASVPNGASVQIVESAGNDWYKITFSDVGGVSTPGYMKGEFLKNS